MNCINNNTRRDEIANKVIVDPLRLRQMIDAGNSHARIVLVKGVYDLFHAGHLNSFLNARAFGDILVVAVNSDAAVRSRKGPTRPIIGQNDRMLLIAALSCVDWVTLYTEPSPYELISKLQPHVFAASHFDSLSEAERALIGDTTALQILPKVGDISTTEIITKIKAVIP